MIEGSRIDHAGHANDPAAQVHEVLAYDQTMAAVLEFIERSDVPTLMVSTSDHETGGLATARQLHESYPDYLWYPGVLANASHSSSWAASQYHSHLDSLNAASNELDAASKKDAKEYLARLSFKGLGIRPISISVNRREALGGATESLEPTHRWCIDGLHATPSIIDDGRHAQILLVANSLLLDGPS